MSTIAKKLAKGSASNTVYLFAQIVVSLFLMPFVVHSLGDRMYGFWALIGTLIGYYGLLDLGLATAVNRHIAGAIGAGDEQTCNNVVNTALPLYLIMGAVVLTISIIIAISSARFVSNPEDVRLFAIVILILGINMAVEFPLKVFRGILVSQIRYDIISFLQMLTLIIRTVLVVAVLVMGYRLLALAIVTVVAAIPAQLLTIYYAKKNLPFIRFKVGGWCRSTAKTLFSYSYLMFITNLSASLRVQLDTIVVSAFMGLAAVTHYRIASLMITYFMSFLSSSIGVIQPAYSRMHGANDHAGINKLLYFSTKISIVITSFIGFGFIFWGKPFISVWMGADYFDAYPVLVILTVAITLDLWQAPSIVLLFATSKHKICAYVNLAEGLLNLLVSILLVKKYGLIGVALGTLIPMAFIKIVVQPLYFCRLTSIKYTQYMYKFYKTVAIVCMALIIPAFISLKYITPDFVHLLVIGGISLIIYMVLILFFVFDSSEVQIMRDSFLSKLYKKRGATAQ